MSDNGSGYHPQDDERPLGQKGRNEPRIGGDYASASPDPGEDRLDHARERMDRSYRLQEDDYIPRKPKPSTWAGNMTEQARHLPVKKIAYGVAGMAGVGVIALGLSSVFTGHRGGIPVFGPPPWPVRTKPADPGGMKLTNVMPTTSDGTGKVVLAPPPEMPHPEQLSAQYGQVAKTEQQRVDKLAANAQQEGADDVHMPESEGRDMETDSVSSHTDTKTGSNVAKADPSASSTTQSTGNKNEIENVREKTPAQPDGHIDRKIKNDGADKSGNAAEGLPSDQAPSASKSSSNTETSALSVVKPSQKGTYSVQLGALNSLTAAEQQWKLISSKAPELFEGRIPVIQRIKQDRGQFYRLRTKGFVSVAEATRFCAKARQAGIACTVANF